MATDQELAPSILRRFMATLVFALGFNSASVNFRHWAPYGKWVVAMLTPCPENSNLRNCATRNFCCNPSITSTEYLILFAFGQPRGNGTNGVKEGGVLRKSTKEGHGITLREI